MNLRLLKLRRFHQKPCYLLKQIASVISMSRRKIKIGRKIKGKALLKRKKRSRKRKYSPSVGESNSDSEKEDSDIDNGSSSESSKEEMSQDEHTSSRFSAMSSAKKNKSGPKANF